MKEIKIVYIDDQIDPILDKYINEVYCDKPFVDNTSTQEVKKVFEIVTFNGEQGYESLLLDDRIRSANVILVDNRLFEERTASGKFSGRQFKVILRKLFPFVEVLIITQDESLIGNNIILKFSGRNPEDSNEYYKEHLDNILDHAIKEVLEFESLADDLKQSIDVDKTLVDKILQSLQGDTSYDTLSKVDIDNLISCFKELQKNYGN